MAMATERPPSERGIEYQLLDRLDALTERLDAYDRRPVAPVNPVNWWDVLPDHAAILALRYNGGAGVQQVQIGWGTIGPYLEVHTMQDRMELTLRAVDGYIIWKRCLFYAGEGQRG